MNNTPKYPWYQVGQMDDLQQGDVIFDIPIIDVSANLAEEFANLKDGDETDIVSDINRVDLIILTQSCDLAHDKIEQVLLCAISPATEYAKNLGNIRSGKMPAFCLIEGFDKGDFKFGQQVVDFRAVYTLPKSYISVFIEAKTKVRLLPPYREHVSQAFARFFMRVGLPIDLK